MITQRKKSGRGADPDMRQAAFFLLFLTSICLLIWGITIYRNTIIEAKYLIITVICGIVIGEILFSLFIKSCLYPILSFLFKALISGGISYFSLLFFNREFAYSEQGSEIFLIIEKGTFPRSKGSHCQQPFIYIDFYGTRKQLVFYCHNIDSIKRSSKVNISYSRGGLGFYIIRSKQLVE